MLSELRADSVPIRGRAACRWSSFGAWGRGEAPCRARLRREIQPIRNDRLLPLRRQQCRKAPLTCGFGARGRIQTDDLPITSRTETLRLDPSRTILAAQVR